MLYAMFYQLNRPKIAKRGSHVILYEFRFEYIAENTVIVVSLSVQPYIYYSEELGNYPLRN